jgi:hypothetical protein
MASSRREEGSGVFATPATVPEPVVPWRSSTDVQDAFKHSNSFNAVKMAPPAFVRFVGVANVSEAKNSSP